MEPVQHLNGKTPARVPKDVRLDNIEEQLRRMETLMYSIVGKLNTSTAEMADVKEMLRAYHNARAFGRISKGLIMFLAACASIAGFLWKWRN